MGLCWFVGGQMQLDIGCYVCDVQLQLLLIVCDVIGFVEYVVCVCIVF